MESIILYSTHCPKCQILEKKLQNAGILYDICDDIDIIRSRGWTEVPILEVYGEVMNFRNAVEWINQR